jgi:hypothetical protein
VLKSPSQALAHLARVYNAEKIFDFELLQYCFAILMYSSMELCFVKFSI